MPMRTPRSVNLGITSRCNLRCSYCSHFDGPGEVADLPTDEWLRFFEELGRCTVMDVCFSGGEAFLRDDIKELIMGVVRNKMRFTALTNGTLIDDRMAEFIASTRRCNSVQVSLDGSSAAVHDACRGHGSHKRALYGIRCLQRQGVPVTVRVTINKFNLNDLEETAKLLLEDLNLPFISTNSAAYLGSCRSNADNLMLTSSERSVAIETLINLEKKYRGRISGLAGPLAEGRMWKAMEEARSRGMPGFAKGGHLTACGCPMREISVRSDGIIIPCFQLSHIELGRINRDDLLRIWLHHPRLQQIRERSKIPLRSFEFCRDCDYMPYCTGNCPALAYTMMGTENHPSPESCLRRFLETGGTLSSIGGECQ
jgi:SynChlorMet cassette radical SAM/SPASM protein ScmE